MNLSNEIIQKNQLPCNLIKFYSKCIHSMFDEYIRHFLILATQFIVHYSNRSNFCNSNKINEKYSDINMSYSV